MVWISEQPQLFTEWILQAVIGFFSEAQVLLCFSSSVPVRHNSVAVIQHVQYKAPEPEAQMLNSAIVKFIICTCAFV